MLEGLYESLITRGLDSRLSSTDGQTVDHASIDEADEPEVLARHVRAVALRALRSERNPERRLALVNAIIERFGDAEELLSGVPRHLMSVSSHVMPGMPARASIERPSTPLSDAALLTNAQGEPGMGHEVRAELASADRVDVIMAFVKW